MWRAPRGVLYMYYTMRGALVQITFLPTRRYASAGAGYGLVSVTSRVGILSKALDGSSWFLTRRLLSMHPTRPERDKLDRRRSTISSQYLRRSTASLSQ